MYATRFEYRYRYVLHGVIFTLCFVAPWTWFSTALGGRDTVWNLGMGELARTHVLSFDGAAVLLLCLAIVFLVLGAALRVWGSAYVGVRVVHSDSMHGEAMLADGPYRRTRNPLYLGTLLHTVGIALVMPVSGAVLCIALIWIFQIRLALAEEPFLAARFGEAYREYAARVPRFLPALTPRVPAAGATPHWLQACAGELYLLGVPLTFLLFGWSFNSNTLLKGILISLGVSMVARAMILKPATTAEV